MHKNLNCELLNVTGRQSELIELALTYGFQAIDLDLVDMVKRCARTSFESSSRFLTSSKLKVAGFETPIDLDANDEEYAKALAALNGAAEIAGRVGAQSAVLTIPAATDRLPYPEYFEVIRTRVGQVAEIMAKENVNVALTFSPEAASAEDKQFKFIGDSEGFCALVRAITAPNVGIMFDSWCWHLGGGTLEQLEQLGFEKVMSIRLADCKEGVEAAAATADDCVLPNSTQVIDNTSYLKALNAAGLDLPIAARGGDSGQQVRRDAFISMAQDALDATLATAGIECETRKPEGINGNPAEVVTPETTSADSSVATDSPVATDSSS